MADTQQFTATEVYRGIGRRVRAARDEVGLSQADVAVLLRKAFGIGTWHQATVAQTEAGNRPLRVHEAVALAQVLACSVSELLGEVDSDRRRHRAALAHRRAELDRLVQHLEQRLAELDALAVAEPSESAALADA